LIGYKYVYNKITLIAYVKNLVPPQVSSKRMHSKSAKMRRKFSASVRRCEEY